MGLVGESGCGKTTTGRAILRLEPKTGGDVLFNGRDVYALNSRQMRALRPQMQIIFQDPYSSLSPRLPVGEIISEAVREHHIVPKNELDDYLDRIMTTEATVTKLMWVLANASDFAQMKRLFYTPVNHDIIL